MNRGAQNFLSRGLIAGILLTLSLVISGRAGAQEGDPAGQPARAGGESTVTCSVENGIGTDPVFKPYTLFNCGTDAYGVGAGDFNHDGRMDVALSTFSGPGYSFELLVFLQNGDRTLGQPAVYPGGEYAQYLGVGDFNHDGWDDLVTADAGAENQISVYLQQSDGTLANRVTYATNASPDAIAVSDVNAGTYDDIIVSHAGSATIGVFTQKGNGTLNAMVTYPSVQAGSDDIAAGDVNGDGRMDVVKTNGQGPTNPNVMVYRQNAGGTLDSAVSYSIASCTQCLANGLAVGDVTGDGRADIVLSFGGSSPASGIAVFAQDGNGALQASVSYPSDINAQSVELGQIDWNSNLDVAVLHGPSLAGVYLQRENGGLAAESLYQLSYKYPYYPQGLDIADVNSDGLSDLLIADGQGLVVLYHRLPMPQALTPSAKTSDRTPTYTWTRISGATQYRYHVMKGGTSVYTRNVGASTCEASTCSDTPAVLLSDGAYTWSAALMLNGIWGDYGAAKAFSVDAVPNLMAPGGVTSDPTPTYKWAKVIGAAQYRYELMKGTALIYRKLVGAAACGASACLNTPAFVLADGSYKWRAQAMIDGVWVPYSLYATFSIKTVPAPLSPSGNILDPTPTYKWTKVAGATQYRYQLMKGTTLVYARTAGAASCGAVSCSQTPGAVLSFNVTYKWRVQAMVGGVWRPYSAYKFFMPNNKPKAGFWKSADGFDRFYVTADQNYVDEFTITVDVPGCDAYQIRYSTTVPIIDRHFSFNSSAGFYASGTFATTTSMSGTDGLNSYYIPGCGTVNGGPWDFSATWQSASQPLTATLVTGPVDIVELLKRGLDGLRATRMEGPVR